MNSDLDDLNVESVKRLNANNTLKFGWGLGGGGTTSTFLIVSVDNIPFFIPVSGSDRFGIYRLSVDGTRKLKIEWVADGEQHTDYIAFTG